MGDTADILTTTPAADARGLVVRPIGNAGAMSVAVDPSSFIYGASFIDAAIGAGGGVAVGAALNAQTAIAHLFGSATALQTEIIRVVLSLVGSDGTGIVVPMLEQTFVPGAAGTDRGTFGRCVKDNLIQPQPAGLTYRIGGALSTFTNSGGPFSSGGLKGVDDHDVVLFDERLWGAPLRIRAGVGEGWEVHTRTTRVFAATAPVAEVTMWFRNPSLAIPPGSDV